MELRSQVLLWELLLLQSSAVLLSSVPSGPSPGASSVVSESTVSWAAGALAVLRCQSPRMVWTQDRLHDRQRVVHWDLSGGPGGGPARRLVDMYSAGEQRVYEARDRGRLLLPRSAFHDGNFSLLIRGKAGAAGAGGPPRDLPGNGSSHSGAPGPDPTLARGRSVINVIVPEGRAHFFQQLGYVLATLLLFILLLITVILATRQRRRGGYEYSNKKSGKPKGKDVNMAEFAVASGDQALHRSEDIQLDYKNNILKERAELAHSPLPAKYIDLDKEFRKEYCK
ncbi:matrix remodeling-associated protein 8 [Suricata suricatta]|uniref:matrix remodeling-associated protein 8 n=1 Tax=Suricata suricatta TaxID=37032 RepID=UPI001155D249|nr:matrix remodeling-associated protein 8 [Suricata suricatta]